MPELPEVERFRVLLLPLVGQKLQVELVGENHKILLSNDDLQCLNRASVTDVIRKGKQLALLINKSRALLLHMGMTGTIRTPGQIENLGEKKIITDESDDKDELWPPKYTHLIFRTETYTAYFCDPRKFGSCSLVPDLSSLEVLAPDALTTRDSTIIEAEILPKLASQRLGIKGILLDQKRAVSGVGNWVADEVLYQTSIHPDQTNLSLDEAKLVWETLQSVVETAVNALNTDSSYPDSWLFMYRWTKKKANKDHYGRTITFLKSAGRTSAIVASKQKLYKRTSNNVMVVSRKRKGVESPAEANPKVPGQARNKKKDSSVKLRRSSRFQHD